MKRLEAREVQWFRGEYREKRYGGARRGKGKNRYVIWLLFLLTFTLVLPSVFVRAETGQITEKTNTNLQPDTVKTDLQSDTIDTTRIDTMQNLLDDLELTQVQQMLDDMLGENSFSLTDFRERSVRCVYDRTDLNQHPRQQVPEVLLADDQ